jgi:aspartate dehydrogenase
MGVGRLLSCEAEIRLAEEKGVKIHVPSGAIVGLDAVKGAAQGRLERVVLTSRKPPLAYAGAPDVVARGIKLEDLREPLVLYEGPAREAVVRFPANVNVAAALSLAGLGADRTLVRVVADPGVERNVHEIELEGDFGRLLTRTENVPAPENPKTSYLACLSAVSTLRAISDPVRIGT